MAELPEFPLFEMDDAEAAFGCSMSRYVGGGYDAGKRAGYELERALRTEASVANAFMFVGGTFADHGLRVKSDLDSKQVHRAISALLKSFAPSHEQKIGTVALAIHHWCEPIPVAAEQAA